MTDLAHSKSISKSEFDQRCSNHQSSLPSGSVEVSWFASNRGNYVATLLSQAPERIDETERLWGALIIDAAGGHCGAVQVDVGLRNSEIAIHLIDVTLGILERDRSSK